MTKSQVMNILIELIVSKRKKVKRLL